MMNKLEISPEHQHYNHRLLQRILEPELMEDPKQVQAYAQADFSEPNDHFMQHLNALVGVSGFDGYALDLGCGPGDISCRFAKIYPSALVDALDGSKAMLDYAESIMPSELSARVRFIHGKLPTVSLSRSRYDLIFSNSLLHHLPEPQALWHFIKRYAGNGTRIAIMDLFRPQSDRQAIEIVEKYAAKEPEILQHDFYHSLLAAFTPEEIEEQLREAGLNFEVERISDRHVFISGTIIFK
ncbi:class I SAM-dependent methyltransferase [Methylotuvimicrobium alcaliphilum]|uniref:Methyltransferase type 11 n=1 Tax=Methylotuvimicrobium alcaliphilum (strain DSM 19304 / NCIMB 14124 / VKM B-2133 / 20Z) TaxID=1091494 RepID=G4SZH1_META2|nr:class I SAM-dependent methyltransferase [Methylotuvimicrobium alcaliphilum]CCE23311.1 Methyltransferase type 11 [Methylotuvimicrobium alcaliphilum 20Z]